MRLAVIGQGLAALACVTVCLAFVPGDEVAGPASLLMLASIYAACAIVNGLGWLRGRAVLGKAGAATGVMLVALPPASAVIALIAARGGGDGALVGLVYAAAATFGFGLLSGIPAAVALYALRGRMGRVGLAAVVLHALAFPIALGATLAVLVGSEGLVLGLGAAAMVTAGIGHAAACVALAGLKPVKASGFVVRSVTPGSRPG
ncbi:MAG: hypothetical protein U1F43_07440 [Myxococcota bacterium]